MSFWLTLNIFHHHLVDQCVPEDSSPAAILELATSYLEHMCSKQSTEIKPSFWYCLTKLKQPIVQILYIYKYIYIYIYIYIYVNIQIIFIYIWWYLYIWNFIYIWAPDDGIGSWVKIGSLGHDGKCLEISSRTRSTFAGVLWKWKRSPKQKNKGFKMQLVWGAYTAKPYTSLPSPPPLSFTPFYHPQQFMANNSTLELDP